jgi:hypothetical protein
MGKLFFITQLMPTVSNRCKPQTGICSTMSTYVYATCKPRLTSTVPISGNHAQQTYCLGKKPFHSRRVKRTTGVNAHNPLSPQIRQGSSYSKSAGSCAHRRIPDSHPSPRLPRSLSLGFSAFQRTNNIQTTSPHPAGFRHTDRSEPPATRFCMYVDCPAGGWGVV